MKYYKTTAPDVLAEAEKYKQEKIDLFARADVFAKEWGGKPVITNSGGQSSFAGLTFSPKKQDSDWTIAKGGSYHYIQKPKSAAKELKQKYEESIINHKLNDEIDFNPVLKSLGYDGYLHFLFTSGYRYIYKNGAVFFGTDAKRSNENGSLHEISQEEFDLAFTKTTEE